MVISSMTQTLDRASSMVRGWLYYGLVKSFPFVQMVENWADADVSFQRAASRVVQNLRRVNK